MENRNIFNGGINLGSGIKVNEINCNTEEIATQIAKQSNICSNLSQISLHRLGTGSYGEVYDILNNGRSSGNVIKISTKSCTSSEYNSNYSVEHEAKILKELKGLKNVVQIKDSGQFSASNGNFDWYIAEKLYSIDHLTINQIFSNPTDNINQVSYSEANILRFAMDLSEALIQIKTRLKKSRDRLIHRDIKLENIMYGYDSSGNIVFKLIDFGISKTFSGTNGGTRIGSYNTMAPEQFFEHKYSANERTDVYALCCVLYKLINKDHSYLFSISANDIKRSKVGATDERLVLNNIYKIDVEDYLEQESHKTTAYPDSEYFSSEILPFGSRELKQAIMEGLSLGLNNRPSPEKFQLAIFKCLEANGPLLGMNVNSFSSYSMYSEFIKNTESTPPTQMTITAETPKFKKTANNIAKTKTEKAKKQSKKHKSQKNDHSNKVIDRSGLPVFLGVILDAAAAILFSLWPVLFVGSYYEHVHKQLFYVFTDYPITLFISILILVIIVKGIGILLSYSYFIKKKPVMGKISSLVIEPFLYIAPVSILLIYIISLFGIYEYFAADICAFTALLVITFVNSISNIIFVHRQRHFETTYSGSNSAANNRVKKKAVVRHTALCSITYLLFISFVAFWQYNRSLGFKISLSSIYLYKIISTSFFIAFCSVLFLTLSLIYIGRLYKKLNYSLTEITISKEFCSNTKNAKKMLKKYKELKKLNVHTPDPATITACFNAAERLDSLTIINEFEKQVLLSINCFKYLLPIRNGIHYGSFDIIYQYVKQNDTIEYSFDLQTNPIYPFRLRSLTLCGINLSTILFISFYPNLSNLNLNKCSLESIDDSYENNLPFSISSLSKLTTLSLADNLITDVESLSSLKNFRCINLSGNKIEKLTSPWRSLRIEEFYCSNNQLVSISGISNLTILKKFDCSNNSITDISFLNKNRYNLEQVNISNNPLPEDAASIILSGCTKLRELRIDSTNTPNLGFVSDCFELRNLSAKSNRIIDATPLSYCRKLETLDLSGNEINNVSFLKNLTSIKFLSLADNKITDISALPKVYYNKLNLSYNNIQSFAPLSYFAGDCLAVSYNDQINFIDQVKYMHQFKRIFFYNVPDDKKVRIEDELGQSKCIFKQDKFDKFLRNFFQQKN